MKNLSIFEPQIEKHHAYKKNMYLERVGVETKSTLLLGHNYPNAYSIFYFDNWKRGKRE